ncbi:hypothetical protein [Calothrix sp. 336/3]|uniref:hypothetical protein n=1 Tax=Calothrix sp. 336/3 TaxID=1337936 RepID=UPI0004E334E5|nr:hypothetical protein [Calothrix sp. 336/3]AKG20143.1 hypothetical protein IJ00_01420 [Calothrix sp. 336/3]
MNYQKLDTALAMGLSNVENPDTRSFVVFIHTQASIDSPAIEFLENMGVNQVNDGREVFTATLSPHQISQLSEQPWIKYLKLSQKLRLVESSSN